MVDAPTPALLQSYTIFCAIRRKAGATGELLIDQDFVYPTTLLPLALLVKKSGMPFRALDGRVRGYLETVLRADPEKEGRSYIPAIRLPHNPESYGKVLGRLEDLSARAWEEALTLSREQVEILRRTIERLEAGYARVIHEQQDLRGAQGQLREKLKEMEEARSAEEKRKDPPPSFVKPNVKHDEPPKKSGAKLRPKTPREQKVRDRKAAEVRERVERLLKQEVDGEPARKLKKYLLERDEELWTWIKTEGSAQSNPAEQGIRFNVSVKRKVSGGSRTLEGGKRTGELVSVHATARMRSMKMWDVGRRILRGDPFPLGAGPQSPQGPAPA